MPLVNLTYRTTVPQTISGEFSHYTFFKCLEWLYSSAGGLPNISRVSHPFESIAEVDPIASRWELLYERRETAPVYFYFADFLLEKWISIY